MCVWRVGLRCLWPFDREQNHSWFKQGGGWNVQRWRQAENKTQKVSFAREWWSRVHYKNWNIKRLALITLRFNHRSACVTCFISMKVFLFCANWPGKNGLISKGENKLMERTRSFLLFSILFFLSFLRSTQGLFKSPSTWYGVDGRVFFRNNKGVRAQEYNCSLLLTAVTVTDRGCVNEPN